MNKEPETKNAKIKSTYLGIEDHGIFTAYLDLDYGGSGQGFGGMSLDGPPGDGGEGNRIGSAYGAEFIMRVLRTLEVGSWEKLPGTHCRALSSWGKVHSIGHILKDQWFNPEDLAKEMGFKEGS
jgi:hypothetical protein